MSGVYKSLQPKDIRTTPYRAHKSLITTFTNNESDTDDCKVYEAEHSLSSSYNFFEQGRTNLDYGNAYFTGQFATTTDGYYKTAVHTQLDHLFYREYLSNNKATLGGGAPILFQYRDLGYKALVISFGTKKVGEGILPESLQITASGYTISDDLYGNLVFDGLSNPDAADYDNVMASYTFNRYYEYVSEGAVPYLEQPVSYGSYKLFASFSNLSFTTPNNDGTVAAKFVSSQNSVMMLGASTELKNVYNMYNRDYAIAFRIKVNSAPASDAVILAKQDKMNDVAVTLDGDLYTNTDVPSQYPYKLELTSGRKIKFSKSDTQTTISMESAALTLGDTYDVVLMRTGSQFRLYLDGGSPTTLTDTFIQNIGSNTIFNTSGLPTKEQDCGNRSNLYVGNNYDRTKGINAEISYLHIFDRSLTEGEVDNLNETDGWLGNYCGNVFYNLGLVVLTHPQLTNASLTALRCKGTVSMRETEVYCTVAPGEFNVSHNRSLQYWNPVHNQFEIDSRYTGSLFQPYVTSIGLYNDNNELIAVAKLSTPIQTSKTTDTTFVVRYDF